MCLKPITKIKIQIYKCNKFFNGQNSTKCFNFQLQLGCLVSHLSFCHTHKTILSFNYFFFVTSLFPLFCRLEVLKLLNSSKFLSFRILFFGHLSMLHLFLLRHWLCNFSFCVLQHIVSYSDAVGSSPPTLLFFYPLFTTK